MRSALRTASAEASDRPPWRRAVAVGTVALAMLGAACGNSSKSHRGTQTTPTTQTGAVETSTSQPAQATGDTSQVAAAPSSTTVVRGKAVTASTTIKAATKATVPAGKSATIPIVQVTSPPSTANTGPQPVPGGTLTYLTNNDIASNFDTTKSNVTAALSEGPAGFALYDSLVTVDPKTLNVIPGTTDSVTTNDAVVWTVKLRSGIKFTDGTPYDAASVKFNWERIGDPANGSGSLAAAREMQSIDVVDATTLRVTLKNPNGQWPRTIAKRLPYVESPAAVNNGNDFASNPVGAGPFKLKEYVRGDHMTFVRNGSYWNAPRPYLDQLIIRPIVDITQRYNTFNTGAADMEFTNEATTPDQAVKDGHTVLSTPVNGGRTLMFNHAKPPFNDPRAVLAVELGIDTNLLTVIEGGRRPLARTLFQPGSPFYDSSLVFRSPDKAQAQTLLNQLAADNGGNPLVVNMNTPPDMQPYAESIQAQLQQLDKIKVNITVVTNTQLVGAVSSKSFQASIYANPFTDPDPVAVEYYLSTSARHYDGSADPDLDKALATAHSTLDPATRLAAWKSVQQILIKDWPELYLVRSPYVNIWSSKVQNVDVFEDGIPRFDQIWVKR